MSFSVQLCVLQDILSYEIFTDAHLVKFPLPSLSVHEAVKMRTRYVVLMKIAFDYGEYMFVRKLHLTGDKRLPFGVRENRIKFSFFDRWLRQKAK